jgi:hypothetical protein
MRDNNQLLLTRQFILCSTDMYINESLFVLSVLPELVEGWFDRLTTNGETFVLALN